MRVLPIVYTYIMLTNVCVSIDDIDYVAGIGNTYTIYGQSVLQRMLLVSVKKHAWWMEGLNKKIVCPPIASGVLTGTKMQEFP